MTLALAALLLAGTMGLGAALLRLLCRGEAKPERLEIGLALGLGGWALGVVALGLGLVGGMRRGPLLGLLVAGAVALGARWRSGVRGSGGGHRPGAWLAILRRPRGGIEGKLDAALVVVLAALAAGNLVRALAPPTVGDGVAYHLPLARHFAAAGGFVDVPTIRQARFPLALDAPWAVAWALGGEPLTGVVTWILGLAALAAAAALGREAAGGRGGALAAGLVGGAPVVAFLQGAAYVDAGLLALVALALASALRFARDGRGSRLAAAGILAGAAAAVKYTALVWPPLVALVVLATTRRPRQALALLGWAAIAAAPWYTRTWALGGSPLWPYAFDWLGGRDWDAAHAARLAGFERGYGTGTSAAALFAAPWRLTFEEWRFDALPLGPAFLALLPLALAARAAAARALIAAGALGGIAWFFATQQVRFVVPLLSLCAAAAAAGAAEGRWRRAAITARGVALAVALGTLLLVAAAAAERLPVVIGREPRDAYLARMVDVFEASRFVNRTLRPSRLLLFREVRGYWLEVPYLWGDPLNQALIDYARLADASALGARLAELGVDAVLLHDRAYALDERYYDRRTVTLMEDLLASEGELVWSKEPVRVYRLRGRQVAPR